MQQDTPPQPTVGERLFLWLQFALPRRGLSRLVHRIARSRRPWLKNALIRVFMRHFGVRLDDALVRDPTQFESFNAFFTRELREGARPMPDDAAALACPCDGLVYRADALEGDRLIQAKGHAYTLNELLAGHSRCAAYRDGTAVTVYLAPRDYHRVHMPLHGTLAATSHVPGDLFSVNATTANHLPRLFARNERLVCHFDTALGPVAVVLVGALNVGSISTAWGGDVIGDGHVAHTDYASAGGIALSRGDELGRFNMGSTVIVLWPDGAATPDAAVHAGAAVRMGQVLAHRPSATPPPT